MTEEEIIKGCKQNISQCQYALFKLYAGRMMSICLRYAETKPEAEDMLQNAFIKILSSIHQFRFDGSFEGWAKRITVHTCLAALRKKSIQYAQTDVSEITVEPGSLQAVARITEKELIKMISRLPAGYRIVFNLHVIEGYSHEEIAAMLNIESATSRSQLAKARKMLQKQISLREKIPAPDDR